MKPEQIVVTIIGRPNVGKSTIHNRLTGTRRALVHHEPGTTRDRREDEVSWKGKTFLLADTGGWEQGTTTLSASIVKQMKIALGRASLVLLVVDGKNGFHPVDAEIAGILRKQNKEAIVVVNKIDSANDEPRAADFYRLGIERLIPISGIHGLNIHELLDEIVKLLPEPSAEAAGGGTGEIRIIFVGKPNVGKSSLTNALLHEERSIVTETPGTTREAVDIFLEHNGKTFILIDTPGLHKKHLFKNDLEYLASLSTRHALERSDVAVLVIDAAEGLGETETKIAELIVDNRRACLIAVNKWDLVENREEAVSQFKERLERKIKFLWWSKIIFISAKTGQRTDRIFSEVESIYQEYSKIVPELELRDAVNAAVGRRPLTRHGELLKIKKVLQTGTQPPSFAFTVNSVELVHFSFRRFLENALRERFGFTGTPIVLKFRQG